MSFIGFLPGDSSQMIKANELRDVDRSGLANAIAIGAPAIASVIGGAVVEQGLWRFYSAHAPAPGGVSAWNAGAWRGAWSRMQPDLYFFGEDAFGNQLVAIPGHPNAYIWSHESGELTDMELDLFSVIDSVASHGLDWIDFYGDGSLGVARRLLGSIDWGSHLHWATPLILGGTIQVENISVMERSVHLLGHGQLWAQVGDLPPGADVVLR